MVRRARERNRQLLGQNIRLAREAKGWTQEELAEHGDLDRSYIGSIERGERNISFTTLLKLARALKVKLAQLMGDLPR